MKKRLFDAGLFLDALRQLRLIGIAGGVLLALEALLLPIGRYISNRQILQYGGTVSPQSLEGFEMHPLLLLCFCALAPLMMLYLFQFLNRRSACDFYHSLPQSRICLFFSFFAAVMTWLCAIAAGSTLLSGLGHLLLGGSVTPQYLSLLIFLFNTLAACLYVCGAVALAMCLTGTLFTNVAVSLLILFMPRLLLAVFCSTLENRLPVISSLHFIPPLDSQYNVVSNLLFGFIHGDTALSFSFAAGGLYTLTVGVLYTLAAAFFFRRRKSETAGKSAPNRIMQGVYRLLVSMLICLIPCVLISDLLLSQESVSGGELFLFFVFYLGAVLVYCLYELFTTRKWRNVVRSLPALGILLLMNAGFIGGLALGYYSTLGIRPDAEEIEAVRLIDRSADEYFSAKTASVRHDSPVIREIVARRLQYTLDLVRESPHSFYDVSSSSTVVTKQVAIYLPGRTIYRNILFSSRDIGEMAQELSKNETFQEAYLQLPANAQVSVYGLDAGQAASLYEVLREEVAALPFSLWYRYIQNAAGSYESSYTFDRFFSESIRFSGTVGSRSYQTGISLTPLLPKTCNQYMALVNQNSGGDVLGRIAEGGWTEGTSVQISGFNFTDKPKAVSWYFSDEMLFLAQEPLMALAEELRAQPDAPPDITKPIYLLSFSDGDVSYSRYINAPHAVLPSFLQLKE